MKNCESIDPKTFIVGQPTYVTAKVFWKPEVEKVLGGAYNRWLNSAGGMEVEPCRMTFSDAQQVRDYCLRENVLVQDVLIEPAENQSQMFWQGRRWPEDFNESELEETLEEADELTHVIQLSESNDAKLVGSVAIVHKNKVCLVKGKHGWTLPGGRAQKDESVFKAAARETKEECGISIKPADLTFVGIVKRGKHRTDSIFVHELEKEQEAKPGTDADEAMWCSLDSLPELAMGHATAIRKALRVLNMKPEERGQLIVFEGVDGAGKSTIAKLLVKWLKHHGFPVIETKWNSSSLISPAIKKGKKARQLSPMLYHLLHSADMLHRYEQTICPALARNFVVVCDRYWPTGIVRDRLRGVKDKACYAKLRKPDALFYCSVNPETAVKRLMKAGRLSWYGLGMDLNYADDEQENALEYSKRMKRLYQQTLPASHVPINMGRTIDKIFNDVKRKLERKLHAHYFHGQNIHERAELAVTRLLETVDPKAFIQQNEPKWHRVALRLRDGTLLYAHSGGFTPEVKHALGYAYAEAVGIADNLKTALVDDHDWFRRAGADANNVVEIFADPIVEEKPSGGVDFYESKAKDFIMGSPEEPMAWDVHSVTTMAGERFIIFRYAGQIAIADICIPEHFTDEQVALAVERLKARVYRAEIEDPPEQWGAKKGRTGWLARTRSSLEDWLRAHGLLNVKWILKEAVDPKKFIMGNRNEWTFHSGDDAKHVWIYCGDEPVFYWYFYGKGQWKEVYAQTKQALEDADRKETFNPINNDPWRGECFIQWAYRNGAHTALGLSPRGARSVGEAVAIQESVDPKDFIMANEPTAFRIGGTDEEGTRRYTTSRDWTSEPSSASLYTKEEADTLVADLIAKIARVGNWMKDIRAEPVEDYKREGGYWRWVAPVRLEAVDVRKFMFRQPVIYNIVGTNRIAGGAKVWYCFGGAWVNEEMLVAGLFKKWRGGGDQTERWVKILQGGQDPDNPAIIEIRPDAEVNEAVDPKKFIMGLPEQPKTWGELRPGDVLHDYEAGSIQVITHYGRDLRDRVDGYLIYYDEYHPAYAYMGRGGPFVQYYSSDVFEPLVGARRIGTVNDFDGDWWNLMRKYWVEEFGDKYPYPESWPPVHETIDAKKFIMRQPVLPDWKFKVDRVRDRGWDKYMARIYFKGENVATGYFHKRPRTDNWKRWLDKAHATLPFVEGPENTFYEWLKFKQRKKLTWHGLTPLGLNEEAGPPANAKDFIMDQAFSVEAVCRKFSLEKTADEYKDGAILWPGGSSHTTRFQSFKGRVPLRTAIIDDYAREPIKDLEVAVVYTEEAFSANTLYDARIDVGIGGRSKKFYVNNDEPKLARFVERHLNRLYKGVGRLRTSKRQQLERALASLGFKVRGGMHFLRGD